VQGGELAAQPDLEHEVVVPQDGEEDLKASEEDGREKGATDADVESAWRGRSSACSLLVSGY
jgi:hypothetical protein